MPQPWIVVVDDDEAQRYATSRLLRKAGYRVDEAATGSAALQLAGQHPNLIILDVKLPDINGFEVCRRIKSDPATSRVWVLHLSAHRVSTAAKVTGLQVGADAYLTQPTEPEELLATVATLLRAQRSEEALHKSEQNYRLLFEANPLPCWVFANDTLQILTVNHAAIERYGYSREEFLSRKVTDLRAAPDQSLGAPLPRLGGPSSVLRTVLVTSKGTQVEVEISWQAMLFQEREATLSVAVDLSERRRALDERRNAELRRQLLDRIVVAQEEERRRIARELHDETGQLLTSMLAHLRAVEETRSLANAKQHARELRSIASHAIDEVGRLARGLHPTVLEDLGLRAALLRLISGWGKARGPEIMLDIAEEDWSDLPFSHRIGAYRIVQEALTNARKHASAARIEVKVLRDTDGIHIEVRDDGVGIGQEALYVSSGLGLPGMRERARSLGGELTFASNGKGTVVEARIPWKGGSCAGKAQGE